MQSRCRLSPGSDWTGKYSVGSPSCEEESPGTLSWHQLSSKKHLLPNQPERLVGCLPGSITRQRLADGNLGQANILHHGPDNRQTARLGGEGVNLIGALPHIAEQAFNGIGAANVAVHHLREGVERE
jgi:hypothetical protein